MAACIRERQSASDGIGAAAVFALAVGGCYMLLTGGHVPIVRSFTMACLFTVAILAGRQPTS